MVGEWGPRQKAELARRIAELGGTVEEAYDEGWRMSATVTAEASGRPRVAAG